MACLTDIRRQIIAGSPHLATVASGNTTDSAIVAHFNTDVSAYVKELKVVFSPKQSVSGDPSPSNVRAINGTNSISVTRCGVNILRSHAAASGSSKNITYTVTRNNANEVSSISMTGTANADNAFRNLNYTKEKNNLFSGRIATNSFSSQANILAVTSNSQVHDVNDHWIVDMPSAGIQVYNIDKNLYSDGWFRIQAFPYKSSGVSYNTTVYPFISLYQDRNSAFEPYNGQTITVTLPDTFYGGYLDLVSGELVETMSIVDLGTLGWAATSQEHRFRALVPNGKTPSNSQQGTGIGVCDSYKVVKKEYANLADGEMCVNNWSMGSQNYGIVVHDDRFTNSQTFKTDAAQGVYFVFELNEPVVYQLTPQTLKTLRGINNIWSDQGMVEVKYWTH